MHQYMMLLIVHLNRDWQNLHICMGLICLLGLPVWFFIPESPRWLAGNDKKDRAEKVFLGKKVFFVSFVNDNCHFYF